MFSLRLIPLRMWQNDEFKQYRVVYYPVSEKYNKWVNKDRIEKAPQWCSVDMSDGCKKVGCAEMGKLIISKLERK